MDSLTLQAPARAEYVRRINLAIDYIHRHIDGPIRLSDVAAASHFSAYHFHRLFHAIVGETVNDFIIRKRMEKAAYRLIGCPTMSVTEICETGGFSSLANFSKAFKQYFGVSPKALRNPRKFDEYRDKNSKIGKLYSKYGKAFDPRQLYSQFVTDMVVFDPDELEEKLMQVKVETFPNRPIAYLTAPKGYELDSIYATWDKIINWADHMGLKNEQQQRFAICHDNPAITPEDKCRYDAAIVIGDEIAVVPPYTESVIPGGQYAVAYFKDSAEKINPFITELCSRWFPESGYEPDNFPPMFNYLNDSRKDGYVEMNIFFKLRSLNVR